MSRDDLLNGLGGAEAQGNEMIAILNEELQAAISEVALQAGDGADVAASYPYIMVKGVGS